MGKLENTLCCIKHLNNFYHVVKPRELSLPKKNGRLLSRTLANYQLFYFYRQIFIYAVQFSVLAPSFYICNPILFSSGNLLVVRDCGHNSLQVKNSTY